MPVRGLVGAPEWPAIRALLPESLLVFTIEHPLYIAAAYPRWSHDEDGRKTWPINRYLTRRTPD
jgi:hypothetical protein